MGFKPEDLIVPGVGVLSDSINAVVDGINTRAARRWDEKMYSWQRADALADYQMQNQYNSPAEQMKRLKAAGLNPNLVYGQGAVANNASAPRQASAGSGNKSDAKINLGNNMQMYLNAKQMELQNDNLTAQNKVLIEQAKNIAADTRSKTFGGDLREFDINYKTENRNRMLYRDEQANINAWRKGNLTQAEIANTEERTKTEIATRAPKVRAIIQSTNESVQRVLNMRIQSAKTEAETSYIFTQIDNAEKDGRMKELNNAIQELELERQRTGGSIKDPWYIRQIQDLTKKFLNL